MLTSMDVSLERVLDLYAGSGALGIEALSRGAIAADFVERDAAACAVIRENVDRIGFATRVHVYHLPVERSFAHLAGPYSVIFVDPPYQDVSVESALASLGATPLIDSSTLVVYEHDRRTVPPKMIGPLACLRTRRHGDSSASIYGALGLAAKTALEDQP